MSASESQCKSCSFRIRKNVFIMFLQFQVVPSPFHGAFKFQRANRVILLSGTPALSRPSELFPQIASIDSRLFPNFREFGIRYCDGKEVWKIKRIFDKIKITRLDP